MTDRFSPVLVVDPSGPTGFLTGVTAAAAGWSHTVALLGNGTLRAWGGNGGGALGDGTWTDSFTPVKVVDPSDLTGLLRGVIAVAAGDDHTMALMGDGTLRAWGWNGFGRLGDGTMTNRSTPVQVVDPSDPTGFLTGVTAVAAGNFHTVALLGNGTLRAWGGNGYGELGDGTSSIRRTPVQVIDPSDPTGFLTGVTTVAAGDSHTVAVLADGTIRAWGYNNYGQLGDGSTTDRWTPIQVVDPSDPTGFLTGVTAAAAGWSHTVALLGNGTLRAWGGNSAGQLGDGTWTDSSTPVQVVDPSDPTGFLTGVTTVAAGDFHTVAVLGDGTLRTWGGNSAGQLGDGTMTNRSTPVQVVDPWDATGFLTGVIAVAAGEEHTMALR